MPERRCKDCGAMNRHSNEYCSVCGGDLENKGRHKKKLVEPRFIYNEKIGMKNVISDAFKLYRANALLFSAIYALLILPYVVYFLATDPMAPSPGASIYSLFAGIFSIWGTVAFIRAVNERFNGRKAGMFESFVRSMGKVWKYFVTIMLSVMLIMTGGLLLIIPGLYLATILFFAQVSPVIEDDTTGSLKMSARLVKGYFWPIFLIMFVFIGVILTSSIMLGFRMLEHKEYYFISIGLNIVFVPLYYSFIITLYNRLKEIKKKELSDKAVSHNMRSRGSCMGCLLSFILYILLIIAAAPVMVKLSENSGLREKLEKFGKVEMSFNIEGKDTGFEYQTLEWTGSVCKKLKASFDVEDKDCYMLIRKDEGDNPAAVMIYKKSYGDLGVDRGTLQNNRALFEDMLRDKFGFKMNFAGFPYNLIFKKGLQDKMGEMYKDYKMTGHDITDNMGVISYSKTDKDKEYFKRNLYAIFDDCVMFMAYEFEMPDTEEGMEELKAREGKILDMWFNALGKK